MFRRLVGAVPQLYSWRIRTQRFAMGTLHEPEFEVFRGCSIARAIDVGANRGQSIVSIKSVAPDAEILAFEPNPQLLRSLLEVAARYEDVKVLAVGCAAQTAIRTLYTPVARGIAFDQWASLERLSPSEALVLIRESGFTWCRLQDVSVSTSINVFVPIDAITIPSERPIDLIKIDVEGAETEVIGGAMELIARDEPLLMAERPTPPLIELLGNLGYVHHRARHGGNALLVHPQRDRGLNYTLLARLYE